MIPVNTTILLTPNDCQHIDEFNKFVLSLVRTHSPRTALFIKLVNGRVSSLVSIRGDGGPCQEDNQHFIPAEEYSANPRYWIRLWRDSIGQRAQL